MRVYEKISSLKEKLQKLKQNIKSRQKGQTFHFSPFSRKQKQVLTWWCKDSPVHDKDGIININSGDITYVQSEDHYLTVHTADGNSYVIRKNMMEFGQDITGTDIIRAHKKYMINYRYISRINQSTNEVIMKAGETLIKIHL